MTKQLYSQNFMSFQNQDFSGCLFDHLLANTTSCKAFFIGSNRGILIKDAKKKQTKCQVKSKGKQGTVQSGKNWQFKHDIMSRVLYNLLK